MTRPPLFLPAPLLNKHMRKYLTPEERQLVLDYCLQNLKRGPDGGDEIDGQIVLVHEQQDSSKLKKQLYKEFGTACSNPITRVIVTWLHHFPAGRPHK